MTEPVSPEPMQKTIVRSGTGDGGATVGIAGVSGSQPTLVMAVPWWQIVLARIVRTYIDSALGVLTLVGFGTITLTGPQDIGTHLYHAAWAALVPTIIATLRESGELLASFDRSHPQLRG